MSLFKWTRAHSIDLPEIDAEHRELYRLGDELHKALLTGAKKEQLDSILANLLEAADQHFRHEERLMRAIQYDALAWHKRQHDTARRKVKALAKQIQQSDSAGAREALAFLSAWLHNHLAVPDRMMASRLRNYQRFNTSLAS